MPVVLQSANSCELPDVGAKNQTPVRTAYTANHCRSGSRKSLKPKCRVLGTRKGGHAFVGHGTGWELAWEVYEIHTTWLAFVLFILLQKQLIKITYTARCMCLQSLATTTQQHKHSLVIDVGKEKVFPIC